MTIDEVITELRGLKLETNPDKKVRELLSQIGKVGFMSVTLHKGASVMRARPNNDGERFTKKADYSYKPQEFNKTYQRASTPNQTMFYGCVLPDNIEPGEFADSRVKRNNLVRFDIAE